MAKGKDFRRMEMWSFWAVAGGLVAAVAVVLVQALRRGGMDAEAQDADALAPDLTIYRDQLAEVDRDLSRAVLTPEEAARVKLEVQRRLLDADRAAQTRPAPTSALPMPMALVLVALVLAGGVWTYLRLGAPGYADLALADRLAVAEEIYRTRPPQAEAEAAAPPESPITPDDDFAALMAKLRAALAERPDDPAGLEILARNEAALQNYKAAAKVQAHLVEVMGEQATADQQITLAQLLIAAAGGYVSPEAETALVEGLALQPTNPLGRYFSGLMFAQVGRPDRAFALWEPLLREGPPDAPWIGPIRADIQDVADLAGVNYTLEPLRGPSAADVSAMADLSDADRQAAISGMVAGLESRLMTDGGALAEWLQLIGALGVLGASDPQAKERQAAALAKAESVFAGDDAALASLRDAAAVAAP